MASFQLRSLSSVLLEGATQIMGGRMNDSAAQPTRSAGSAMQASLASCRIL